MFSRRIISLIVVLSLVAQTMVLVNTETYTSNFVEDSSPLEELPEYGVARTTPANTSIGLTYLAGGTSDCACYNGWMSNGEIMIFGARGDTGVHGPAGKGYELYVTDGTRNGTSFIKDINPGNDGIEGYEPHNSAWLNDVLYLSLDDGSDNYGYELWRTDATESGTYMVKDIREGSGGSNMGTMVAWEDHIYFGATDGTNGTELWKSDGTENGTIMVKDIYPGGWLDSSAPSYFTIFNDKLYFRATNEDNGTELWTTDGTESGTEMVFDLYPGIYGNGKGKNANPSYITVFKDYMYFYAINNTEFPEANDGLWRSDGTEGGTTLVKDIYTNAGGSPLRGLTSYHSLDSFSPSAILDSGTPGSRNDHFAIMGDKFYFSSLNWNGSERDIYVSDGTEEGTYSTNIGHEGYGGSSRLNFGESKFVFVRDTEDYGEELWISDGTEGGTHLVKDIREGDKDADIDSVVPVGDTFYFGAAAIQNQGVLWKTDGTEEGTVVINLPEGRTAVNVGETGRNMILLKNDLIYVAFGNRGDSGDEYRYFGYGSEFWILKNVSSAYGATPSYTLYKDVAMNPITFDYDGADATWEISPDLPPSLSFNSANGTITGIPDELFNLTSYTVYANITAGTPPDSILYYNVGDDDDGDGYWEDTHGNDDYDIAISNLDRVEATGNTDLTHAYRFDSSSDLAVMGNNFQDWAGDLTDDSISIEMWFNPSALSGNKILWEIGGTSNGNSLVLMGDKLTYRLKTSGDNAYVNISTTISQDSEFHNAVVVLNKEAEMAYLYYDGELKANASFSGDFDWGGNNDAGIGCENDNVGGYTNSEQTNYFSGDTTFRGDIAIHRILEVALDSSEVEDLYGQFTSYRFKETYEINLQSLQHPDSDGDGICDGVSAVDGICAAGPDAFPFDAAASVDTDGDGMPDTLTGNSTSEPPLVEDLDDDNDGLLDLDEIANGTEPLNPDTDGDGYCDGSVTVGSCIAGDVFPTDVTEWFDTDGDGTGNNADTDDDNDGLDDTTEASSDPVTNSTNPDTDGDGICDGSVNVTINEVQICSEGPDELPTNPNETVDTDGDGIGNNEDTDDDNDGLSDDEENAIGTDPLDPDTDGDFYCDGPIVVTGCAGSDDAFPLDDSEWLDTDGDGIGNNADPDDDGDSYDDIWENENGYDSLDGCVPNLNSTTCDQDYDGLTNGEENVIGTNVTNPDTDGDGFCDGDLGVEGICVAGPDDFPLDPAAHLDTDGDGMPDTINGTSTSDPALIEDLDDDNDGLLDLDEIANGTEPLNPDSDGDGYCDGLVTIVDVCVATDAFPTDVTEWFDTDGDGTGNNADSDDDNDGLDDTTEASSDPVTNSTNPDTDGDGICDGSVNVTINDVQICLGGPDELPTNSTEWIDTDDDGTGNNADLDDDGDGYNDTVEIAEGSDPLDSENIPLDTDGDKIPDSTDTDDDNDGYNDTVDAFPTNSAEWLDTDDDGTGNNADTDDDGDGLSDDEENDIGTDPLDPDTDGDGIPDNWDPMPVDPDGDIDKDGILDRDEYKPNADGEPADSDGNGVNDMRQVLASSSSSSSSDIDWRQMCCWALLLLLLLLFPLGKRRYDNSLVYDPREIEYTIGDNDTKIRMVPSLHEFTKKYIKTTNSEGLRRITYAISGNLVEGLDIDSKTGIVSGHPEKVGEYRYGIVMKHSKGKFKGEVVINVREKGKAVEKEEEPEREVVRTVNPEPENTKSKPKFKGGAGTKMDPFVITPAKGLAAGEQISSKQAITISGLKPGGVVNMEDIDSSKNGKRFAIVAEPDEVGRQSVLVADDDGKTKFRINFKDDEPSYDGADYEGLLKLGISSVYFTWATEVLEDISEADAEKEVEIKAEEVAKEEELKVKEVEIDSKQAELDRIAAKAETIDFGIIGTASASEKDDLKIIKGIGPFIEEKLNALGIYKFAQIAKMTSDLEDEVNIAIEFFPGRVKRDKWVKQAKELAE